MKNKMKNKKGFTLMEMLIVVAIMVVLVAVAVPTFSKQVTSAKQAADDANLRAAKAVAATNYLSIENFDTKDTYYFNPSTGGLDTEAPATTNYYGKTSPNKYIIVTVTNEGVVTAKWHTGS